MEEEPLDEDVDIESEVESESDDALSAASTPPYFEEGFFPPSLKSGKPLSLRRGRGRPKKEIDRKPLGIKLKRWRSGVYVKGEGPSRSPRTPTGDNQMPWGGKSPADSAMIQDLELLEKPEKLTDDPPYFTEAWPGKLCALCGLSERSILGQKEMLRLNCPEGLPERRPNVSPGGDKSPRGPLPLQLSHRRQRSREGRCAAELLDELSIVGYIDEVDAACVVEPSGTFYVHASCIMWAEGVTRVDAVEGAWAALQSALVRRCNFCSRYGASIVCAYNHNETSCGLYFHFPCAIASGAFLEPLTRTCICSLHLDQVPLLPVGENTQCATCSSLGNVANLLICTTCDTHFHGSCVGLALTPSARAGWQCFDCRTCQVCRLPSEIGKIMICETCDKGYHPACLRPMVTSIPKYGWKCKCCRVCSDCGSRTPGSGLSSRWHNHFSVCDSCYQQRNKGFCCPICGRAYRAAAYREMVQCTKCKKFVHGICDADADLGVYMARKESAPDYEYVCSVCKVAGRPAIKRKDSMDDSLLESSLSASQESLYGDDIMMDLERSPSERDGGTGLGKGKPFSAKKRLGSARPKFSLQKMKRVPELVKKRGIKSKMRGVFGVPGLGLQRPQAEPGSKCDEEPGVENRMVLCSGSDKFVTSQDMCVMCGALGTDQEGCLMACVQCGQCYHPYCVNVKVTKVILTKGWRCLDCTVCEGCGQRNDESRLTLCDDCDISYHIYCMDPPLETVPRGVWKCKWCVVCVRCGTHEAGFNCNWMNGHTECGPCASHTTCPVCAEPYSENELVIQCVTCSRWLHGFCDSIRNEADAEQCASDDYSCLLCRPRDIPPPHIAAQVSPPQYSSSMESDYPRPSQSQYFVDGVCLSESGMQHIRSLTLEHAIQRKKPRAKRSIMPPPTCEKEARFLATIESVATGNDVSDSSGFFYSSRDLEREEMVKEEIYREGMEVQRREDGSAPEPPEGFTIFTTESGALVLRRKRVRNLQKLGIGGFLVRVRTAKKDGDGDCEKEGMIPLEKPKRKPIRRKPRSKLVESFPSYLQEAFFGRELLDMPKEKEANSSSESERDETGLKVSSGNTIKLSKDELRVMEDVKAKEQKEKLKMEVKSPIKEEDDLEELEDLPLPGDLLDNDLVDTIMAEGDDIKPSGEDSDLNEAVGNTQSKDELSDILSSNFPLECGLPDMDGRDVEEIFKGVLTDENQRGPNVELTVQAALPTTPVLPPSFPPPSPYHSEYSNSPHSQVSEPPSPWLDEPPLSVEPAAPSASQRSTPLKMEADEALGLQATISSVLYANTNHPEWKTQYPVWSERYKQIVKKWRSLSNEQKAPYLQHARDNRSALRMKKTQQIHQKESPPATSPLPSVVVKTASVGSGPDVKTVLTSQPLSGGEVCEETAPALEQLTPSTNPPTPSPESDDRVESGSQTDENIGIKSQQVRVLLTQPRPQNIVLRNVVIANNVLPPRGLLHLDLTQRAPNVTIRAFEAGGLARLHRPMTLSLHAQPQPPRADNEPAATEPPDHQIRVLTPSEIMRTLPSLDHSQMDQDKALQQQKVTRETEQERQWKQLQAVRLAQQQQHQQVIHEQRVQALARMTRPLGPEETAANLTSQLQVSTNQEPQIMSPMASPSPGGRPQFPVNQSVKVTRIHPSQSPSPFAQPMTPRPMRPPLQFPLQSPIAEQFSSDESFSARFTAVRPPASTFTQRQEPFEPSPEVARQLRELLQRQKEGVPGSPTQRPWSQESFVEGQEGQFRQPLPPGNIIRPRMPTQQLLTRPPVRQVIEPRLQAVSIDQRIRMMLQQQQPQSPRFVQTRNPLDPYDEMVQRSSPATPISPAPGIIRMRPAAPPIQQPPSDQQEIPESVMAELEQVEQESGPMAEAVTDILEDLDEEEDILAGMGADFNILEYVDTDTGSGDKSNILDHLDLDEEDKKARVGMVQPKADSQQPPREVAPPTTTVSSDTNLMTSAPTTPTAVAPAYSPQRPMSLGVEGPRLPMRIPPGSTRVIVGPGGQIIQQGARMGVAPPPPYPGPPPPYPGPGPPQMAVGRFGPMYHQQDSMQRRSLLLQEQPLLLEDLLEQEKREQEKQQHSSGETEIEGQLTPPAIPSLSPVVGGALPGQGLVRPPFPRPPYFRPQAVMTETPPPPRIPTFNIPATPPPPLPPDVIATDQDRQMAVAYESWLTHQNQLLQQQLKYYETEVQKLRKVRKSLNSKQRQLRKNGNELNENDAMELQRVTTEQSALQKHLDASRKACRQHGVLIQEYQTKQQKNRPQGSPLSPLHPSHSPLHSVGGVATPGYRTSPHPNTPQSPMMSPSPSPLHSPGPQGVPMQVVQSPISPHSRQPSPRMGTPHSQPGEESPFSPSSLPSPQTPTAAHPRLPSPRLVASPGLQDQSRLIGMGQRFVRAAGPNTSPVSYQGPGNPRLVYAAPGTTQVLQRNLMIQQQRTQQLFQQLSQQNPNMTMEQKQKLLQQITQQQQAHHLEQRQQILQQMQQNQNSGGEPKQQMMVLNQSTGEPKQQMMVLNQSLTSEQRQQLIQAMQQNSNMTQEQKQQLLQQITQQQTVVHSPQLSMDQKQQIMQQISQQHPNMTLEQRQQLLIQVQNQQQQQIIMQQSQEQKPQVIQMTQQSQPQQLEQKQIMHSQGEQQNPPTTTEQKQHNLLSQLTQQNQEQKSQLQQQSMSMEQKQMLMQQIHQSQNFAIEQRQQIIQQSHSSMEHRQQIIQQNHNLTNEQKQQLLHQLSLTANLTFEQRQKLIQHQQQKMQHRQQLIDQQMLQQQQQLAAQNQQRLMIQPTASEQDNGGGGQSPGDGGGGGGGGNRNAPIPIPSCIKPGLQGGAPLFGNKMKCCIKPGLRGGAPMWSFNKGKRFPKPSEDEPSTSQQVSVLRQRPEGFVNLLQLQNNPQQQVIIQLGQNNGQSPAKSLVCVDYDSSEETPPGSPDKKLPSGKDDDRPEEIRLATDAEGIELLSQEENLLNLELEDEEDPDGRQVIIIGNSPESEKSSGIMEIDEDIMVYERMEVLGEVIAADDFDISNCEVMEFEGFEEEEEPIPARPPVPEPSQQQLIVRHTKKGRQIVMVKRGEEGKDHRQIIFRSDNEEDKSENAKIKHTEMLEAAESAKSATPVPRPATPSVTVSRSVTPTTPTPVPRSSTSSPVFKPVMATTGPQLGTRSVTPTSLPTLVMPRSVPPTTPSPSPSVSKPIASTPDLVPKTVAPAIVPISITSVPTSPTFGPILSISRSIPPPTRSVTPTTVPSPLPGTLPVTTMPRSVTPTFPLMTVDVSSSPTTRVSTPTSVRRTPTPTNTILSTPLPSRILTPQPKDSSNVAVIPLQFSNTLSLAPKVSLPASIVSPHPVAVTSSDSDTKLIQRSDAPAQVEAKATSVVVEAPKREEQKTVVPTISFPDFPEGLASKFMSAECTVIKKPEHNDPPPMTSTIRAAKTYEKFKYGKPKPQLSEHDYTTSVKPVKIDVDETDITSHIAKIDPKVRDIISISKITPDAKKLDRRKSMDALGKRKSVEERRRSSENKREFEQRRLQILEEIKQEQKKASEVAKLPPTTKTEHDLSDVIDILENIDSTTSNARLLSSSELQSIEKTPLFENDELDQSPTKPKLEEHINIQSLLNESGKSDLQMSDLARGSKQPVIPPPAQGNHSKLAALLTGGKVPTLETLLEKEIEKEEKIKIEPEKEPVKTEPSLLLSPTTGLMRTVTPVVTQPSPEKEVTIKKEPVSQAEMPKPVFSVVMNTRQAQPQQVQVSSQSHHVPTSPQLSHAAVIQQPTVVQQIPISVPQTIQHASQQQYLKEQQQTTHHVSQLTPQQQQQQIIQQLMASHDATMQQSKAAQQQNSVQSQHSMSLAQTQHPNIVQPTPHMQQPPRFQLVASTTLQRLSVPSAVMSTTVAPSRTDESQNVLLKQLLQNTACATGASSPRSPTPSTPSPITSPTIKKEPMEVGEMKMESAEELKKLKRRQYQQKRRQSQGKEGGTPKKRARKGSRMEEDYESYTESLMSQLKTLPPLSVMEPQLPRNFHVCPVFGYSEATLPTEDNYSIKPFGDLEKQPPKSPVTTQRGFYEQEFSAVQLWSESDDRRLEMLLGSRERDTDTPDTVVSTSSPETVRPESPQRFPALQIIKEENEQDLLSRSSPPIPVVVPIPIRPRQSHVPLSPRPNIKEESKEDKENVGPGNVKVTLTLNSDAARDILTVLKDLANLLHIPPPTKYHIVERTTTPPSMKLGLYRNRGKDGKEGAPVDIQSILIGQAKFCKHCDIVILSGAIRKKVWEVPFLAKREDLDSLEELYFCSSNCFMQFSLMHKSPNEGRETAGSVVDHVGTVAKDASPEAKPLKGTRYKYWQPGCLLPPTRYKRPTERELMDMLFRAGVTLIPSQNTDDTRRCLFCHQIGDGVPDGPARLLNFDVDKWVHLNCALWSDDVYERVNGALMNVDNALQQGQSTSCALCGQLGATIHCFKVRCSNVYHLSCATKDECVFFKNKTTYCQAHVPKNEKDNELTTLSVFRRVYVQRDEERQVATMMHHSELNHIMRVGSLIFLSVGQLLPHQLPVFHTSNYIYPVGYKIIRFYWSMRRVNKRCQYVCSIHDAANRPEFRILVQEPGYDDIELRDASPKAAWLRILEPLQALRKEHGVVNLYPRYVSGEDLFGLTEPAVVRVLESLPGVETLTDYKFKYGRNPLLELPLAVNPTGSARSEPRQKNLLPYKRPHTQRTGASSRANMFAPSLPGEPVCPYSKQFVHSKSSQYKKMKLEWRNNVYLARSKIQGLGLYAARDLERHTMVIEYIGEIIRHELSESREKQYESRNRGIYMFRLDEERVVDATISGGLARYINHSCNPNCVTEIVEVDRELRIIIFAKRRITRGEELSYDYKFDIEDDQHKISCLCGAPNCRKWMN